MLFNETRIYRIVPGTEPFTAETLEEAIKTKIACDPGTQELSTAGFKAPVGKSETAPLVFAADGFLMVCLQTADRILPGAVVNEDLRDKVDEIEANQSRKVYKKERDQLKDEIVQALLPRAFVRRQTVFAAIDQAAGLIYVNKASDKRAEAMLSTLRESLGSLRVRPLRTKITPSATMTDWIKAGQAAQGFTLLGDAQLVDTADGGGAIRVQNQDLSTANIQNHVIEEGMIVNELAIAYKDQLSFVLDDKLTLKRIRFEDLIKDQAAKDGGDDADGQYAASVILMMKTYAELIPELLSVFGGEEVPESL